MNGDSLLGGQPLPAALHQHLYRYWARAVQFFDEGDYALAAFAAVTLIEEVGKVIVLGLCNLPLALAAHFDERAVGKSLRDHRAKYRFAVGTTLCVNSRVSRIYGEHEHTFARWFREDELFDLRNRALYAELSDGGIDVPQTAISIGEAFLLVCISGEIYGEVQGEVSGTSPAEWKRVLDEVDAFRERHVKDIWG